MCIACRQMKDKCELIRIVKGEQNQVNIDEKQKANGRGAYVCKNLECIEKCCKQKSLNRAFKCNVDQSVFDKLRQKI
ncbi:MAG: YlxR family protein [Clostridia bacterium]|nr:YlxR family protein [Clostridia bacterium]